MRFATLGSGSAGNATIFTRDDDAILIDCGLSVRQIEQRLDTLGFPATRILALLLTHEHDDHIAGAAAFSRKYRVPLYLTPGTRFAAGAHLANAHAYREFAPGETLQIGTFTVLPVIVPHDAREPCQFIVSGETSRVGVLTDFGQITSLLVSRFQMLDALVLEFNHELSLLEASQYPASLKTRIAGNYGHLSNAQAQEFLKRIGCEALRHVVAAHLSEKTNTPERVADYLRDCLPAHVDWTIASQHHALPWCELMPHTALTNALSSAAC
jgi:phosphoribosyl 1,2-cyclic phosphodiesterase